MEQILFVRDGMWYAIEGRVVGVGPTSELLKSLQTRFSFSPTFLPYGDMGCASFGQHDRRRFYLMYLEPKKRVIQFLNEATREKKAYSLILPHTYIALFFRGGAIENGYALCSKKKVTSLKDPMGMLPFPNLSLPYGQICTGNRAMWPVTQDPSETAMSYLKFFLTSEFTAHINQHVQVLPKEVSMSADAARHDVYGGCEESFNKWQKITDEKGLDGILAIDWKTEYTLESIIRELWHIAEEEL